MTDFERDTKEGLNNQNEEDLRNSVESEKDEVDLIMKSNERTIFDKMFSRMHPGSLRASIFNLSILSIGVGCLSLPQRFMQISVIVGIIVVISAGLLAYWTLQIIIEAGRKKGITEYSKVILEYCGYRWSVFADITIIVYIFGILIVYQIIGKI